MKKKKLQRIMDVNGIEIKKNGGQPKKILKLNIYYLYKFK